MPSARTTDRATETAPPAGEGLAQASRPRTVLVGPAGHPLHPVVASIAAAALVGVLVFDLGSFVADQAWAYTRAAYTLCAIGIGIGVIAAVVGLVDLVGVPRGTRTFRDGVRHLVTMDATLVLFAVSFLARRGSDFAETESVALSAFVPSTLGVGLLILGVLLGHRLAYRHGVRVAVGDGRAKGFAPGP